VVLLSERVDDLLVTCSRTFRMGLRGELLVQRPAIPQYLVNARPTNAGSEVRPPAAVNRSHVEAPLTECEGACKAFT
jgi:hypothetical protein